MAPIDAPNRGFHQRLEQSRLRWNVEVDRTLGDARPGGDLVEARLGETLVKEDLERGVENGLKLVLTVAARGAGVFFEAWGFVSILRHRHYD